MLMSEPLFMYMVQVREDASGATGWAAITVQDVRTFTRAQAEDIAAQITNHPARFLFPYTDQSAQFADDPAGRVLAMIGGETMWFYGEPFRVDMIEVLKTVMDGAESPDRFTVLLPVADVVRAAAERFGAGDPHQIEMRFDALVMDLGGRRERDPPAYLLNIGTVLGVPLP
jgi:hypothetical protein